MTKVEIFSHVQRIKKKYLRVVGVLMAQALEAPGSEANMQNIGTVGWKEPLEIGERIRRYRQRHGGSLEDAAKVIVP